MGKGQRIRSRRVDKRRRRAARAAKQRHGDRSSGLLGDDLFAGLDDTLLDTSRCPIDDVCAGCGSASGLHAVTAAFSGLAGLDVACATLCRACDGHSFLHLLTPDGLHAACHRHAAHQPQVPRAGVSGRRGSRA